MKFNYAIFSTMNHDYLYDGVSCNIFMITPEFKENHGVIFNAYTRVGPISADLKSEAKSVSDACRAGMLLPVLDTPTEYWFDEEEYRKSLLDKKSLFSRELSA